MQPILRSMVLVVAAAEALLSAQSPDAGQVLASARAALGVEKQGTVKTLRAEGRTLRTGPGGNTTEAEFELALELPDRYRLRTALAALGNMSVYRHTGFNGNRAIEEIDRPPNLMGGNVVIRIAGPNGPVDPTKLTPEQKAEADRQRLTANKRDFARLALGLLAGSAAAYPLDFAYAGQAEAPDGKADIIDVKGEGVLIGRLYVDANTHLPLMLSWTDKEPLIIRTGPGGGPASAGGPGTVVQRVTIGPGDQPGKMSKEDAEKLEKDLDARRAEAEARRRTVEFRIYYGDYRPVDGVKLPHRIQRAIDGKTTEEMLIDSWKVNTKIDARTFEVR